MRIGFCITMLSVVVAGLLAGCEQAASDQNAVPVAATVERPVALAQGFEDASAMEGWKVVGDCAIDRGGGFDPSAPSGEVTSIRFAAKPFADGTGGRTYEVAFPWQSLAPFTPATAPIQRALPSG